MFVERQDQSSAISTVQFTDGKYWRGPIFSWGRLAARFQTADGGDEKRHEGRQEVVLNTGSSSASPGRRQHPPSTLLFTCCPFKFVFRTPKNTSSEYVQAAPFPIDIRRLKMDSKRKWFVCACEKMRSSSNVQSWPQSFRGILTTCAFLC